jgi:hypothetical protein
MYFKSYGHITTQVVGFIQNSWSHKHSSVYITLNLSAYVIMNSESKLVFM